MKNDMPKNAFDPVPPEQAACLVCGSPLRIEVVSEVIPYATPKGEVQLSADVPYEVCEECGYRGFGDEGEQARTEAIYRFQGKLPPSEIIQIRKGLNLTQSEFAEWLGVGHASLERWEAGLKVQNESMNNLILLMSNPANKTWLDSERLKRMKRGAEKASVVPLAPFRGLQGEDEKQLLARCTSFRLRR